MDDNNLYALIWKIAGIVLCVAITSVAGCQAYIAGRPDPIAAACALATSNSACTVMAGRAAKSN